MGGANYLRYFWYLRYLWEGRRQLLERYLPDLHRNGVIQFPRLKSQATKGRNGFGKKKLEEKQESKMYDEHYWSNIKCMVQENQTWCSVEICSFYLKRLVLK